jgi:hypothetical protein
VAERKAVLATVAELAAPLPAFASISDIRPRTARDAMETCGMGWAFWKPVWAFEVYDPVTIAFQQLSLDSLRTLRVSRNSGRFMQMPYFWLGAHRVSVYEPL